MILRELRTRILLVRIRQYLISRDYQNGHKLALSTSLETSFDVRVIMLLADACLFCGNSAEAKDWYNQAIEVESESKRWSGNDKRFLGAYISYRLLECKFLLNNDNLVAKAEVVVQINELPASSSLKALFFLDSDFPNSPRPYGSRRRYKRQI